MLRLFANANYKFIELRKFSYTLGIIAAVLSIVAWTGFQLAGKGWVNYGVDFAGGTLLQLRFDRPVSVSDLRTDLEGRITGTEITNFGGASEFLVRAPRFSIGGANVSDQIVSALREKHGTSFTVVRTEAVGPKVGNELQQKALLAILLSFGATLIYLAFRFEWRFGVAAVITTIHDIIMTLGVISILRIEVSLTTVAAVLTIVGYSLNDTIIIFDRIRENLKKYGRKVDLVGLINKSINETLPRTTLTVSTTLATLAALALLGGSTIRGFATIMFVGIILATYSSIFVASPVLYEIEKRWGEKPGAKTARQRVAL